MDPIRPPDKIKREQLCNDLEYVQEEDDLQNDLQNDFQRQLELALNESVNEYKNEVQKRTKIFEKLLFDLTKLLKMDKEVKFVYDIIEPIIVSYCSKNIETCEIDGNTYERIFHLLSKVRTDKTAVELLKLIILSSLD